MAESVDALVSNTSGAIHPGSIPGLGTKKVDNLSIINLFSFSFYWFHSFTSCLQVLAANMMSRNEDSLSHHHLDAIYDIEARTKGNSLFLTCREANFCCFLSSNMVDAHTFVGIRLDDHSSLFASYISSGICLHRRYRRWYACNIGYQSIALDPFLTTTCNYIIIVSTYGTISKFRILFCCKII